MDTKHAVHLLIVGLLFLATTGVLAFFLRRNEKTSRNWRIWLIVFVVGAVVIGGL